tara:strand:- start:211 stop:483 length:273 start_codon:yes stop_codon:yes gene_type:complete
MPTTTEMKLKTMLKKTMIENERLKEDTKQLRGFLAQAHKERAEWQQHLDEMYHAGIMLKKKVKELENIAAVKEALDLMMEVKKELGMEED